MTTEEKYEKLLDELRGMDGVAVAFSGGTDSSLLLWAAHSALGRRAVAVTVCSPLFPAGETEEAEKFCRTFGITQEKIRVDLLETDDFRNNPPDRCYLCKRTLLRRIFDVARERGLVMVVEGSNLDDDGDYRPGLRAVRELGVKSPLRDAGLSKAEIRTLSKKLNLPGWDRPSSACLASRIPYGEEITRQKLTMAGQAEAYLRALGFSPVRVRIHCSRIARIEVRPEDLPRLLEAREDVCTRLREIGFSYVTMDLDGYRTGSLNEVL